MAVRGDGDPMSRFNQRQDHPGRDVRLARSRRSLDREQRLVHGVRRGNGRSEEHTSELQSLMRISYAVFCLKKKTKLTQNHIMHMFLSILYTAIISLYDLN